MYRLCKAFDTEIGVGKSCYVRECWFVCLGLELGFLAQDLHVQGLRPAIYFRFGVQEGFVSVLVTSGLHVLVLSMVETECQLASIKSVTPTV
jgi:hypothetical protein